ncbi:hypothetical protein [Cyanobium sp. ATX 6F1]|uniref:hypothetical protein n=1 Tax=unclassified Cyanobium TaxID=2627006 RepID=UPI0020CECCA6|nr:hypothetical protein [Cyanobium sp. ATX 6F1]
MNDLREGDLIDEDELLVYVNLLKNKLLKSRLLQQQAASQRKEEFSESPDLQRELSIAITGALDTHSAMSTEALNEPDFCSELKVILLNIEELWEGLRKKAEARAKRAARARSNSLEDMRLNNVQLLLDRIPDPDGDLHDWSEFAHTIDGYEVAGSFEACAALLNDNTATNLTELRCALFFLSRQDRHGGYFDCMPQARELLRRIQEKVKAGELE